jgi:hypothetical protein
MNESAAGQSNENQSVGQPQLIDSSTPAPTAETYEGIGDPLPDGVTVTPTKNGYFLVESFYTSRRTQILAELGLEAHMLTDASARVQRWLDAPERYRMTNLEVSYRYLPSTIDAAYAEAQYEKVYDDEAREELLPLSRKVRQQRRADLMVRVKEAFRQEDLDEVKDILIYGV